MEQWCGPCEGEEVFEGSGQFIFRALFDPLAGEDEGGDGGGSVEKENRGWLDKKQPMKAIDVTDEDA